MTENVNMLIVDDEQVVRESLHNWFTSEGYRVEVAAEAMSALGKLQSSSFDIVLLDIKMPGMDGLELQRRIKELDKDLAVIIMTAYASVDTAVQALKDGAYDYITKPIDPDDLSRLVRNAVIQGKLAKENLRLKQEILQMASMDHIIGESSSMKKVLQLVTDVAPTDTTVMILGESGTGKEIIARAIHMNSNRRYFPIIPINCGALPDTLAESELFGHERGAFTGAQYRRKGKLEIAHRGTIFFDEIGNIGLKTQMDLLRVIETKRFTRLGGNQTVETDFRIISATNKNLEQAVKDGTFREDLYYRLNVFSIELPPLRERKTDIPLLVEFFIKKYSANMNKPFQGVTEDALEQLQNYDWPGNIRELQNAVERAMVVGSPPIIRLDNFPLPISGKKIDKNHLATLAADSLSLSDLEKHHITSVLEKTKGNVTRAAQLLQIDRQTLYNKMKKYGLQKD